MLALLLEHCEAIHIHIKCNMENGTFTNVNNRTTARAPIKLQYGKRYIHQRKQPHNCTKTREAFYTPLVGKCAFDTCINEAYAT